MKLRRSILTVLRRVALLAPIAVAMRPAPRADAQQAPRPRANPPHCPAQRPHSGETCQQAQGVTTSRACQYRAVRCYCVGFEDERWQWSCGSRGVQRGPLPPPELANG